MGSILRYAIGIGVLLGGSTLFLQMAPKSWLETTAEAQAREQKQAAVDGLIATWMSVHCVVDRVEPGRKCSFCKDEDFWRPAASEENRLARASVSERLGGALAIERGVTYCEDK